MGEIFSDATRWERALESRHTVFAGLAPGSRIGIVPEAAVTGGSCLDVQMIEWVATGDGLKVGQREFAGFEATDVDILIAADDVALAYLTEALEGDVLAAMRRLIRDGHMLFFARKARRDLETAGYDDLLDQLGFAFMGACR
ncbi:MAG: hypothetical protein HYU77_17720 [Betaproteobacteria bacterium]|nr:hypothetical protein [Betaproteobacteria bacterium]